MNSLNLTGLNITDEGHASPYSYTLDDPMYKQYKPVVKDLIPLPKPVLYLLMAAIVVVGVAYAIVGHLIKDLAIDIAECVLGPTREDELMKEDALNRVTGPSHPPPVMSLHNAFHVWDQDDVVIPCPPDDGSPYSPSLLSTIPYIPSFFPIHSASNSPAILSSSPSPNSAFPRET